jgi:predicted ATPase
VKRLRQRDRAHGRLGACESELGVELGLANNAHSVADLAREHGDVAKSLRLCSETFAMNRRLVNEAQRRVVSAGIARSWQGRGP